MLRKSKFPILEFDNDRQSVIEPIVPKHEAEVSKYCVLCFLQEVIDMYKAEFDLQQISAIKSVMGSNPIYQFNYKGNDIVLVQPGLGAAYSAGLFEEIIALGCRKIIACGTCGVMINNIRPGEVIIPTSAVRDEGVSYHYLPPTREVISKEKPVAIIEAQLLASDIPFRKGKVWTTDGFYRETRARVDARLKEGCLAVEMEVSALMAVAEFRSVDLGYILIAADDVSGELWDQRLGKTPLEFRKSVIDVCLEAVTQL